MMFTDVLLPAPFAPSSATVCPAGITRSSASTAVTGPNRLVTRSNVTASVVTPRDAIAPTQLRILPRISGRP